MARRRRSASSDDERPGVTVVTVTWNSKAYLSVLLDAVRLFSPDDVEIVVVDNHSTDGTSEMLAERDDVRAVELPVNLGHGIGLDAAFVEARTEHVVVLDVDAFPITDRWLDIALDPLRGGAKIAGAHVHRSFVHPCFLAMARRTYLEADTSFAPIGRAPQPGEPPKGLYMDVGEALSHSIAVTHGSASLHRLEATSTQGPGMAGSVFGEAVYHNFYSTQGKSDLKAASAQMWDEAVARYLG